MKLEEQKTNKRTGLLITVGILLTMCLIVGISYAYWQITKYQEDKNVLSSGCFDIALEGGKPISLENAYPLTDSDGQKTTPYTFTIKNTCDLFASFTVNLEMLEGTTMASKYVKVMVNKEEIQNLANLEMADIVINNSTESRKLISGSLGAGDSEEYNLRLWMDGDITSDDREAMNKQLLTKIVVKAAPSNYNPVDNGITLLKDAILANEYQTTDVEVAKSKIASKQSVDFTKTAPIIEWQESHATNISVNSATFPSPSLIGSGISGTENLTATNILPTLGTGYTFNSETGFYALTNVQRVDPTTLDFKNNKYYLCNDGIGWRENDNGILSTTDYRSNCYVLTEVTGVSKSEKNFTTSTTNMTYKGEEYKFLGYRYSQIELESDKSDKGIYQINDGEGLSYYYRGNVKNNNVYFAGAYWKIIRINGDGSIRLLYSGKNQNATGEDLLSTLTDSSLGYNNSSTANFNIKRANPAYVGYMYGNTLNSSYAETTANENDSDIKKYLDSWYKQNIDEKGLSSYIADSGFCNDRSLASGDGVSTNKVTYFSGSERYQNSNPLLLCTNTNDLFTLSSSKGNGALTYPVGLITIDELMLSGMGSGYMNKLAYTYSSVWYSTISPWFYDLTSLAGIAAQRYDGSVVMGWVNPPGGVRPVINLKADTEISGGIGTSNEPFLIK